MTTAVTVDAHAGWPVEVQTRNIVPSSDGTINTEIVQPNTKSIFYIHDGLEIISIKELPK